ncbi:MAG: tryptophan-rich sensory protein [Lactobacillaceae bacterium]|jgi:tryptophan-rich sensory protein|nr:tryptophan-rich sensory protein [Lactobacillaceae bacterium]
MVKKAIVFSLFFLILGSLSGFITDEAVLSGWYNQLNKPLITPPNWIFTPMWFAIYVLMGFSIAIIYDTNTQYTNPALVFFGFSFIFNILWTVIFFVIQSLDIAFINIIVIDITLIVSIYYFYKIDKKAFYLLLPYAAWILFATYLSAYISIYN